MKIITLFCVNKVVGCKKGKLSYLENIVEVFVKIFPFTCHGKLYGFIWVGFYLLGVLIFSYKQAFQPKINQRQSYNHHKKTNVEHTL